jgi:hypothetical protein
MTTERILEITNHVSEDELSCVTKAELAEAVRYWSLRSGELAGQIKLMETQTLIERYDELVRQHKAKAG